MKIAVIGAGAAGLAALRHCISDVYNNEVICYEREDQVGGTWIYREEYGMDQYGLPIHTSMYKNLRANLPKEIMGFPDYPMPDLPENYLHRTQILEFLNSYCDHFKLRQYIRFLHHVALVKPMKSHRKWIVIVKDLPKNSEIVELFDAVMVCNGHFSKPNIPKLKGQDIFQGQQMHSHNYRIPEIFDGKTVVVFGAGPSALDISRTAKLVFFSHHMQHVIGTVFPDNVVQKSDVVELLEHSVRFKDDTIESVDVMFYCTGYQYDFSFLDETCGIHIDSNMVTPLWKHIVSTENPTLAFIGLPTRVCAFHLSDLQVRFVLQFWSGKKNFPSMEDMLREETEEFKTLTNDGMLKKHFHVFNERQKFYADDLAKTAEIEPISPVIINIYDECYMQFLNDLVNYRNAKYKIIDDYNFIRY
ncbi:senecionine N-oxygenase-like isoform X2 [Xylocopa sonorina]|uniref:senecionine N-oxygenase-like isoform X2 n=1 Tax=Xylocopa sonorina TaxID=1818115 RepID=UPI00403AF933